MTDKQTNKQQNIHEIFPVNRFLDFGDVPDHDADIETFNGIFTIAG